jgi:hypothetical protein
MGFWRGSIRGGGGKEKKRGGKGRTRDLGQIVGPNQALFSSFAGPTPDVAEITTGAMLAKQPLKRFFLGKLAESKSSLNSLQFIGR